MKEASSTKDLFNEFNKLSKEDWIEKVAADLKGQTFDDLFWKSPDNIVIQPFYTAEDTKDLHYLENYQHGFANIDNAAYGPRHWTNYESIKATDTKEANKAALHALNNGADGLLFDIDEANPGPGLEILLDQIMAAYCHISFRSGKNNIAFVKDYFEYLSKNGLDPEKISGFYDHDIIAKWTIGGELDDNYFQQLTDLFQATTSFTAFKPLTISSHHFEHSGAGPVQEIAFALNTTVDYLDQLTDLGLPAAEIIDRIQFSCSIGSDFFMEIAKVRAFRILFHQLAQAYGLSEFHPGKIKIHCTSSFWNKSLFDINNNMLRNTTEAMAAILGGCDSLQVMPHDHLAQASSTFSRRIARNISSILREEAYLDKVVDPAAGSYYIENLTHEFVTAAWTLFLEIEKSGGFIGAFKENKIQQAIDKTKAEKFSKIANRRSVIVGVNQYPHKSEKLSSGIDIKAATEEITKNQQYQRLNSYRASEQFEVLKTRTLRFAKDLPQEQVPKIFVATLGESPIQKTRISFIDNTFACAGFDIVESSPNNTLAACVDEAIKAKERIVIICGSNEDYEAKAIDFITQFKQKEAHKMLFLAGKVDKNEEDLLQAGLDGFIHLNSDVIQMIRKVHLFLGISEGEEVKIP
ncbi:methylmalonyl-CoA mutase family protein [Fulvivirgaceae bacterium BMA12]|uniref:Methylmalonyl-CoA mutase family protein n=1 Tax=Agaribacillus aureus TaxID=3051825 RepID=A0ABT8LG08_9BACT|nr:methylmalonyl-CoA mutase family protein [Fulvivirgaceae bacterium BMA12]